LKGSDRTKKPQSARSDEKGVVTDLR
jgi:hypothetical protein